MGQREADDRAAPQEDESGTQAIDLVRAVRDAISLVSDDDEIVRNALRRAHAARIPTAPVELTRFMRLHLLPEIEHAAGEQAAASVRDQLRTLVTAFDAVTRARASHTPLRATTNHRTILVTRDAEVIAALDARRDLWTALVSGPLALRAALVGAHPAGPPFVVIDGATEDALAIASAVPELEAIGALLWRASPGLLDRSRGSAALRPRLLATSDAPLDELLERLRRVQSTG